MRNSFKVHPAETNQKSRDDNLKDKANESTPRVSNIWRNLISSTSQKDEKKAEHSESKLDHCLLFGVSRFEGSFFLSFRLTRIGA
jgi:hypothetical protein